ncbi:MAG: type II toxin-antitoxin system VapC family toxin [Thermodesulfobacteriota bacterium]
MIILDTHAIIWDALKPEMLSARAKTEITKANKKDGIIFCEISMIEIALMFESKMLSINIEYEQFIDLILKSNKYELCGLTADIAMRAASLPFKPGLDIADRIIAATAIVKKAKLVTADAYLSEANYISTIW